MGSFCSLGSGAKTITEAEELCLVGLNTVSIVSRPRTLFLSYWLLTRTTHCPEGFMTKKEGGQGSRRGQFESKGAEIKIKGQIKNKGL